MVTRKEIKEISDKIVKNYSPEKIILFGSYGSGNPTKDSDVDLFIIKETKRHQHKRHLQVRRIIKGELPVDVLVYTPKETQRRLKMGDFFIKDILKKGKVLYEASQSRQP